MPINDLTTTAREYREIQALIKQLEAEAETLKQKMIAEMDVQQAESITAGEYTIRYSIYASNRVDTTALKKELPDIAARYIKSTVSTRFQVA